MHPNEVLARREIDLINAGDSEALKGIYTDDLVVHYPGKNPSVEAGRFMASCIPEARFVELPGEDHFPNGPDYEPLVNTIREVQGNGRWVDHSGD
jgi:hypothetical protein